MIVSGDRIIKVRPLDGSEMFLPRSVVKGVEDTINACNDTEELMRVLAWMETFNMHLVGSRDRVFPSYHLLCQIYYGNANIDPRVLTRTLGLRYKYLELIGDPVIRD